MKIERRAVPVLSKRCPRCGVEKAIAEFRSRGHLLHSHCKPCERAANRRRRAETHAEALR